MHPEIGTHITYPGAFVKTSGVSPHIFRRPPLIGEHNLDIYKEELGLSSEDILLLKQANVI